MLITKFVILLLLGYVTEQNEIHPDVLKYFKNSIIDFNNIDDNTYFIKEYSKVVRYRTNGNSIRFILNKQMFETYVEGIICTMIFPDFFLFSSLRVTSGRTVVKLKKPENNYSIAFTFSGGQFEHTISDVIQTDDGFIYCNDTKKLFYVNHEINIGFLLKIDHKFDIINENIELPIRVHYLFLWYFNIMLIMFVQLCFKMWLHCVQ